MKNIIQRNPKIITPAFDKRIVQVSGSLINNDDVCNSFGECEQPVMPYQPFSSELDERVELINEARDPSLRVIFAHARASQKSGMAFNTLNFEGTATATVWNNEYNKEESGASCSLSLLYMGFVLWRTLNIHIEGNNSGGYGSDAPFPGNGSKGPRLSSVVVADNLSLADPVLLHTNPGGSFSSDATLTPGFYVIKATVFYNVVGYDAEGTEDMRMEFVMSID